MSTVNDLLSDAFVEAGILAAGEALQAGDAQFGLRKLNRLLSSWSADGFIIYKTTTENFSLNTNVGGYVIGEGNAFDTTRPVRITKANLIINDIRYGLEEITSEEYHKISSLYQVGRPTKIYIENAGLSSAQATAYFWPLPDQDYYLELTSEKLLGPFSGLSSNVNPPAGYERMIVSNLAVALCPSYGLEPSGLLLKEAQDSYAACARFAFKPVKMESDLASLGSYDINSRDYEA